LVSRSIEIVLYHNIVVPTYFVDDSVGFTQDVVAKIIDASDALLGDGIAEPVGLAGEE
jgi:hypothetical protein